MSDVKRQIPIAKPTLSGDEVTMMRDVVASGWVSMGAKTRELEAQVAQYMGTSHGVAMNSCTSALHVAMLIHGIGPGDDVICPSYSFIATANSITHSGATARFADIDPDTLNLCPKAVETLIQHEYPSGKHHQSGSTLKGILLVHQIGIPADIDTFNALAQKYNLTLIEDSACVIGSHYKDKSPGAYGNTGALSFHPRKVITTGEGGMLITPHAALAEKAGIYRAHGMSISDFARHQSSSTTYEQYDIAGYNYRLTDLQAVLGLEQMKDLESFIERRMEIRARYDEAFSQLPGISVIQPKPYVTRWNVQSYPIRLNGASQNTRDQLMENLYQRGIATRRGIPPIHQEPVYAHLGISLPQTEAVSKESLFLPIYPLMRDEDITYVIDGVTQETSALLNTSI